MAEFVGTYKFEKDDGNFEDFLKAMNVGLMTRKVACNLSPSIEISTKDDGTIVVKTVSTFKNSTIEFKLGEEFEQKRMDDKVVKTVITQEGNKLIEKQHPDEVTIYREFNGDSLITTCECGSVKCVRQYKKQA